MVYFNKLDYSYSFVLEQSIAAIVSNNSGIAHICASGIYDVFSLFLQHCLFVCFRHLNASVMLMLGVPDKYAMERGGWSTNATLKAVYQHTFSDERKRVDEQIDGFFEDLLGVSASR